MRLRGNLLVVLGLLVLGSYVHASLHAMEHAHEDCPLQLFCSGAAAATTPPATELPEPAARAEAAVPAVAPALVSTARAARSARGPPRS